MNMPTPEYRTTAQKAAILQDAAMKARAFIGGLEVGQKFPGLAPEAEKHYAPGTIGYVLFIRCAMIELEKVTFDMDQWGTIMVLHRTHEIPLEA